MDNTNTTENVTNLTDSDFETYIAEATLPVVVDFWAPWCGPCRLLSPILAELATLYAGKVNFVKVNVDENPQISEKHQIMSIPTVKFFWQGKVTDENIGLGPKQLFVTKIENALKNVT